MIKFILSVLLFDRRVRAFFYSSDWLNGILWAETVRENEGARWQTKIEIYTYYEFHDFDRGANNYILYYDTVLAKIPNVFKVTE